jgi:hypothetical protein
MEVLFEMENQIDNSIEALEKALQEEQEIADQLLKNAEERKKAIEIKLKDAKEQKRKQDLHKITEIVRNLHAEYGADFVEVVKREVGLKAKRVVLSEVEKEDYTKYLHLFNRGYTSDGVDTFNQNGQKITASIPAQKTFEPYFTMNPKKYAKLWTKFS